MEHNRLIIRGMGNTDATYALRVMNSQMYTSFIIRDDKRIGIHNNDPKDILHVGSEIVFHDGDSKSIRINSYYDGAAGYSRNITSVRPSFQIGTSAPGGDNGVYMFIDKKEQAGERLWQNYDQSGYMKGLKILPNGNIGISEVNPSSRLVVFGQGNDAQSSSLEVKNSDNSSLLFVRDDGYVGINNNDPKAKLQVTKGAVIFDEELDEYGNITENQLTDQEKTDMAFTKGCRFMWIPGKHALRVGRIDHDDYQHAWDYDNCGLSSFAFGHNVSAEGHCAFAKGARVRATGDCSVAIGGTFLYTNGMDDKPQLS
jgi:hypothetical protein